MTNGSRLVAQYGLPILVAVPLWAQTFDFENGISGWTQTGDAFRDQPYCGPISSTMFAQVKLRGNYWKDLAFPLGHQGACLVTSIAKRPGSIGSLTSPEFSLDPNTPFFSFRIGGSEDVDNERLELQVRLSAPIDPTLRGRLHEWSGIQTRSRPHDGSYWTVYLSTGHGSETLRQEVVEIPDFLKGLPGRIRILDDSENHHINVDLVQFTSAAPPPLRVPVWGLADYHTHPMSYMAFGGMKGIPTLWGNAGGNFDDYGDPTAISRDLQHCVRGHHGGYLAEPFINSSQLLHYDLPSIVHSFLVPHGRRGGPEFDDFPSHLLGAHEQMHITMIHRAYQGGLRLLVALATDNKAAQFLTGRVQHGHMVLIGEQESMEAQLCGMKRRAELNNSWMEIAYSSADARRTILHGKLAIVLGVEYDQLGELGLGPDEQEPQKEVDYLWGLGARAVTPIHAINNRLGGPAVFIGPYNWLNDLLHRPSADASSATVRKTTRAYFEVTGDSSCAAGPRSIGECVLSRLDSKLQLRVAIGRSIFNWLREGPTLLFAPRQGQFETEYGNKNARGLTAFGARYISALMDLRMILDTAHMSDRSVADTFIEIGDRLARQHPGCDGFSFESRASQECDADAYPAIISHAHFRGQAICDRNQPIPDYLPSEYDISNSNLAMVRRIGGVVGPFVAEPRTNESNISGIANDCGNSSKNFGFSFRYAADRVNTPVDDAALASRVGFATDMTFIAMISPRFGKQACEGYLHENRNTCIAYGGASDLEPSRMVPSVVTSKPAISGHFKTGH
jgi:microsomal dipeptidase-like Zn-dependent dipeptidase